VKKKQAFKGREAHLKTHLTKSNAAEIYNKILSIVHKVKDVLLVPLEMVLSLFL